MAYFDNTGLSAEQIVRNLEMYRDRLISQIKYLPNGNERDIKEDKLRKVDYKCNQLWMKVRNESRKSSL